MADDTFLRDIQSVQDELDLMSRSGTDIAKSAAWAGVTVLKQAAIRSAIGTIKREIGGYVRQAGEEIVGKVGLMMFPKRGQKKGPHGIYLESGTKYIVARHMISIAMNAAISRALDAAERAADKKINQILRKGKS
jgi:hypothetical protein